LHGCGGADQLLVDEDLGNECLEDETRLHGDLRTDSVSRQEDDLLATSRRQVPPR
jgi:hypothetical protein